MTSEKVMASRSCICNQVLDIIDLAPRPYPNLLEVAKVVCSGYNDPPESKGAFLLLTTLF